MKEQGSDNPGFLSRLGALKARLLPARDEGDGETPPVPSGQQPETDDRWPRLFGMIVIAIAFLGVGGWAATARIDGAVVATGVVTVDSYRKTVQHLEGGIVESIHVRDGDVVEPGDLLVLLDETQARASYLMNWSRYVAQLARKARLRAELEGDDEISFPDEVLENAEHSNRTREVMRTQEREFETRREALEGELNVLRHRREQLDERIAGMEAQYAAKLRTVESLSEELESRQRLVEREAMPASELRPLERQLAEAEGQAGELRASIAASRIEAGEAELQIIQRRREFNREVIAELGEVTNRVDELEEELRALEDTLGRKQIVAPVGGEVVNLRVHAERGVVGGGEPILDIVPEGEPLVVEARVQPQDIDNVELAMMADVRFTSFSFRRTPVIEGEVVFVSADRLEDENTGDPYYLSRIVVSDEELAKLGDNVALRAGMPADVMIKTGERTPLQYLAQPLADALARSFRED